MQMVGTGEERVALGQAVERQGAEADDFISLLCEESVQLFKTKGVGQGILAAAFDAPVAVMETAGEGGPWGMAILASYMMNKEEGESLASFLDNKVFAGQSGVELAPDAKDVEGFDVFVKRYTAGLAIEKAAVESLI